MFEEQGISHTFAKEVSRWEFLNLILAAPCSNLRLLVGPDRRFWERASIGKKQKGFTGYPCADNEITPALLTVRPERG